MIGRDDHSFPGPERYRLAGAAVAAVILLASPLTHAERSTAVGHCRLESSNGIRQTQTEVAHGDEQFTVDVSQPVWDQPTGHDAATATQGVWCYANEEGRVRGRVVTGADAESPIDAKVHLDWFKTFTRTPGTSNPRFTVTPSHLLIEASQNTNTEVNEERPPEVFADMRFKVYLGSDNSVLTVFEHRSRMQGLPGHSSFEFEEKTDGDAARVSADGVSIHPATAGKDVEQAGNVATFDLPTYSQAIDLDRYGVDFGDEYTIVYELEASAGELVLFESRSEALIGDPLDADTGFMLSTVHEPAAQAVYCESVPDPARYENHGDGTVTDTRTGLMWQRCPVGFAVDDAGTPNDRADDLCAADAGASQQLDWQGALQAAAAAAPGGFDDWRAPNVKEIESLIEACHGPAQVDPLAFPGMPAAPFWTATPEPEGGASPRRAWLLGLDDGEIRAAGRETTAYVLPVRDTGAIPVAPGASVAAGDASVLEGDAGAVTLALPVALSAPLAGDVSVDYAVSGLDAVDGVDFTAAAGTLTIPAGATVAHVEVAVLGDTEVEPNELVQVELGNLTGAAWLRRLRGIGTIVDDEPMFQLASTVEVAETDSNGTVDIAVRLDRPAVETVSIDYATVDGTAVAGNDYLAAAGTVVIQPGDTEGVLPLTVVGDLVAESTEQLQIEFDSPAAAALVTEPFAITVTIVDNDGAGTYSALNDTGVTTCASDTQTSLACPQPGYPGQDAEHGRDITDPDTADGALGFSFVKRDGAGDPLADQGGFYFQTPWDCVEDQVTGLLWEVKTDVQGALRFSDDTFTWYHSSGNNDGGEAGTPNGGACADGVNCDTEKYVAAVNGAGLCGFNDWRLPSADELFTIAWLSAESFNGVDTSYFPNNVAAPDGRGYWSSTPSASDPQSALRVRFDAGVSTATTIVPAAKSNTHRIRLVRGGKPLSQLP